ncbi:hypothetical protein HPP92_027415 [Vanilla planifolia]|uniref:Uncharacterized protein n=1 Tax=Vanilla planifolia TaxID=51239 RepID=A0A835P990_VANPL|nr:hypothetical protein HPP92_027415 [Vanilla planifolia]
MASLRWAYVRIISGTILGGILGFYERRKEEMKRYEMNRRQHQQQQAETEVWSDH